jgi:hypothetical protein
MIGGMSWESTAIYYRAVNEETQRLLGGQHNARSIKLSVDFAEVEAYQVAGRWDEAAALLPWRNALRRWSVSTDWAIRSCMRAGAARWESSPNPASQSTWNRLTGRPGNISSRSPGTTDLLRVILPVRGQALEELAWIRAGRRQTPAAGDSGVLEEVGFAG